jgi:hypothetical protein
MDSMFEEILVESESGLKRALEIQGRPHGWPRWRATANPDRDLLAPAVRAISPRAAVRRRVRGDLRTRKDEWGEYVLRQLASDPTEQDRLGRHPFVVRLRELMPPASS